MSSAGMLPNFQICRRISGTIASNLEALTVGVKAHAANVLFEPALRNPVFNYQRRCYANLNKTWSFSRVQYTKYRISKPWTTDTQFEDLILSEPSREDFAKFTKELPIFLRFLKLVTGLENRPDDFIEFARRCENGLSVEKDVFITKKELIDCLWKNGFSDQEISAFEIAFPANYHFHYPELAILFDIPENQCYQYCIRQRSASPEKLVELKYRKPTNLLSSYGLAFLGVWSGLSNTVLSNAWFYAKTFPFVAVFYMLASNFYREIREYFWKEERIMIKAAKEKKEKGEKQVLTQMKKYANDALSLEYLSKFKEEVQKQLDDYQQSLVAGMRKNMTDSLLQKLNSLQQAEKSIQDSLQNIAVKEIVKSFREDFLKQPELQDAAFKSALNAISGRGNEMDPVGTHFKKSFHELQKVDLSKTKPNSSGSVVERVAAVFQQQEKEFLDSFTIKSQEAVEVQRLVSKCKSESGFDFSKLNQSEREKLEELYSNLNYRLGFDSFHEDFLKPVEDSNEAMKPFIDYVNKQIDRAKEEVRNARLRVFAQALS